MATKTKEELQRDAKIAIANACVLVRDALRETLPIAPEQYMTVSIPGTVVDTNDIAVGGTYVYDAVGNPFPPTQVRQAESRLVDGMMPLANVMVRRASYFLRAVSDIYKARQHRQKRCQKLCDCARLLVTKESNRINTESN